MIFKNNKYLKHVLSLIILTSCATASKNKQDQNFQVQIPKEERTLEEISEYKQFFDNDLNVIQEFLENKELNQDDRREIKLLKTNYKKILSHKDYVLKLNSENKYSRELIKFIYDSNLPIKILWEGTSQSALPENLLDYKVNGFCSSLYEDAINSILKNINNDEGSTLVIYSDQYQNIVQNIISYSPQIWAIPNTASNFQDYAAEILGIHSSSKRFKKISSLNPNQKLQFNPRPRKDLKEIILLVDPKNYKAMIPALRYHGGNNFKYLNFISALEEVDDPLQLLDYEDSYIPISANAAKKIGSGEIKSLQGFLRESILHDWLSIQLLDQSGSRSTYISGSTGSIFYRSNSCSSREIPLQKITPKLFSD